MIRLAPEHVGGRVLLSDGEVGFVASHDKLANEYTIKGDGFYFDAEQDDDCITLLLDAPNPLDVEVPEWCEEFMLWDGDTCLCYALAEVVRSKLFDGFFYDGWSPAPGEMPPKNNEEYS